MKLLIIINEIELSEMASLLRENNYSIASATDGQTGFKMAVSGNYDLIIVEDKLPRRDGIAIIEELRSLGLDTPILLMSAKDSTGDRVAGLDSGADDYLVKPFKREDFLARLRALARRKNRKWSGSIINAAGLILDVMKCEVKKGDEVIKLSLKETLLLELLMQNYGHVITKECIFEKVWGFNSPVEYANVDLYIHYLRKKINVPSIKTVRGVGYYFDSVL